MKRRHPLAAALTALMLAAAAPPPVGIFGNVRVYPETDDLGGIEIAFVPNSYEIEIVWCQGWCGYVARVPYTEAGGVISFVYREPGFDKNGAAMPPFVIPMTVRRRGRSLIIAGPTRDILPPTTLKPLAKPFGLDVARSH
jgi:hypothetical protein